MIEPAFKIAVDNSPYGETVVIETYRLMEEDYDLGGLTETESLSSMRERLEGEKLILEGEPEEDERKFRIDRSDLDRYLEGLEEIVGRHEQEDSEPLKQASCVIELYQLTNPDGHPTVRMQNAEMPKELAFIYSGLYSQAFRQERD